MSDLNNNHNPITTPKTGISIKTVSWLVFAGVLTALMGALIIRGCNNNIDKDKRQDSIYTDEKNTYSQSQEIKHSNQFKPKVDCLDTINKINQSYEAKMRETMGQITDLKGLNDYYLEVDSIQGEINLLEAQKAEINKSKNALKKKLVKKYPFLNKIE